MFGGLLEKGGYKFGVRYNRHAFSGSLRSWCNIGGFNIGGVTRNPPICQVIIPHQYFRLYGTLCIRHFMIDCI